MARTREEDLGMRALMVHSLDRPDTAGDRAARALAGELESQGVRVIAASSCEDAALLFSSDAALQAVLLDWDAEDDEGHHAALGVIQAIRARNTHVPIFLCADRSLASSIPLEAMGHVDDFMWLLEDTPRFMAGRVVAAIRRYRQQVLPPMFAALAQFAQVHEYSWHTPGHTGGTAFLKTGEIGRAHV